MDTLVMILIGVTVSFSDTSEEFLDCHPVCETNKLDRASQLDHCCKLRGSNTGKCSANGKSRCFHSEYFVTYFGI